MWQASPLHCKRPESARRAQVSRLTAVPNGPRVRRTAQPRTSGSFRSMRRGMIGLRSMPKAFCVVQLTTRKVRAIPSEGQTLRDWLTAAVAHRSATGTKCGSTKSPASGQLSATWFAGRCPRNAGLVTDCVTGAAVGRGTRDRKCWPPPWSHANHRRTRCALDESWP